jgi:hypothetical protein
MASHMNPYPSLTSLATPNDHHLAVLDLTRQSESLVDPSTSYSQND